MLTFVLGLVGAIAGAAIGLFAPVFIAGALAIGTGSYEEFLLVWIVAVPGGFIAGALGGARIARKLARSTTTNDRSP